MTSPLEPDRLVALAVRHRAGQTICLTLHDVLEPDLFAAMSNESTHGCIDAVDDFGFEIGSQTGFLSQTRSELDDVSVHDLGSVLFHEVQHKGGFAGAIDVQQSCIEFQPCIFQSRPAELFKNAVSVVESSICHFKGASALTFLKR